MISNNKLFVITIQDNKNLILILKVLKSLKISIYHLLDLKIVYTFLITSKDLLVTHIYIDTNNS